MKKELEILFERNKREFAFFKEEANKIGVASKWGQGVIPPYSILPFYSELLGNKPGRFLKKASKPGVNKQCYLLNTDNQIINGVEYDSFNDLNSQWIVSNKFYFYSPDSTIQYSFGSAFENETNARLERVTIAQIEDNKIKSAYSFGNRSEYEELYYSYQDDRICGITQKVWVDAYFERHYIIMYDDISILEILSDGTTQKIYPE